MTRRFPADFFFSFLPTHHIIHFAFKKSIVVNWFGKNSEMMSSFRLIGDDMRKECSMVGFEWIFEEFAPQDLVVRWILEHHNARDSGFQKPGICELVETVSQCHFFYS